MAQMNDLQEAGLDHSYEVRGESESTPHACWRSTTTTPAASARWLDTDEFTAVCPWTGLPDFGTLTVRYVPDRALLELKSFKYYLLSYRQVGIVQEHAANRILQDLVAVCRPLRMSLTLDYKTRGGIHTMVEVSYSAPEAS